MNKEFSLGSIQQETGSYIAISVIGMLICPDIVPGPTPRFSLSMPPAVGTEVRCKECR